MYLLSFIARKRFGVASVEVGKNNSGHIIWSTTYRKKFWTARDRFKSSTSTLQGFQNASFSI